MLAVTLFPVASIISFGTWLAFLVTGVCVCVLIWYVEERIRSARLAIFIAKRDELLNTIENLRDDDNLRCPTLSIARRLDSVEFKLNDLSWGIVEAQIGDLRSRIDRLGQLSEELAQCASHVVSHDELVAGMTEIVVKLDDVAATRQREIEKLQAKHIAVLLYEKRMHQNAIATVNQVWDAREAELRKYQELLSRELGDQTAS